MRADEHPEYPLYLRHKDLYLRCQTALTEWESCGKPVVVEQYGFSWTPASARELARSLSQYFQAYNQVLWEEFPYCRSCLGQCCAVSAATVELFDLLALVLLDCAFPEFAEYIAVVPHHCIYQTPFGCIWPEAWRTQKCWLFYCVGPLEKGLSADAFSVSECYLSIAQALNSAIGDLLPQPLKRYEQMTGIRLHDWLDKPLSFSKILTRAVIQIFLFEFHKIYSPLLQAEDLIAQGQRNPEEGVEFWSPGADFESILTSLQEVVLCLPADTHAERSISDQVYEDLETLEWIVLGRPENSLTLLNEIYLRYAQGSHSLAQQSIPFGDHIRSLAQAIQKAILSPMNRSLP